MGKYLNKGEKNLRDADSARNNEIYNRNACIFLNLLQKKKFLNKLPIHYYTAFFKKVV